jgi:DNA-binding transcriptional LysR family regulator
MMLQLRSLNHLVVLAKRLNYARAAEDIGISQSALSRSIQALELQLGMRLLDRDRASVSLTPSGQTVVQRANVLLADADDMERQLRLVAKGHAGRINFGMAPMPARALLSGVLSKRLKLAPDVTNEVVVRDVEALWGLLVAGEIEFFVGQEGSVPESPPSRAETLGHFPLSLIVRAGHPLLQGHVPDMTFPIIRSSWAGLPLPSEILGHVRGPANVIEDFGSLSLITATSDAIWFSSSYAVTEELISGRLQELHVSGSGTTRAIRVVLYTLARRSQSPLANLLKQAFRQQIRILEQARK